MSTDPPRVDEIEQPEPDPKTLAERLFTDAPTPGGAAEHMDPNFDLAMKPLQPYPPGVPVDPHGDHATDGDLMGEPDVEA
jgi:hypothetical protein